MTLHRPPLSVEQAMDRIFGQLRDGINDAATHLDRSVSYLRACSHPGRREKLSVADAIALDLLFRDVGGIGAPIYEAYTVKLKLAEINRFADRAALAQLAPEILRECGEAGAALVAAMLPDACAHTRQVTRREVKQAIAALTRALPLLSDDGGPPHQTSPPATGAP